MSNDELGVNPASLHLVFRLRSPHRPSALGLDTGTATSIRFTAQASGGTAPLEYKFYLNDVTTNTWTLARDWAPGTEWVWQPSASDYGVRAVQVWIRSTGSTAAYEAYTGTGYFVLIR